MGRDDVLRALRAGHRAVLSAVIAVIIVVSLLQLMSMPSRC